MAIEWSSNLATGLEWQDRHHKELFKRINRLLDAMAMGSGKDEVKNIFDFLDEYFVFHFEAEEQAMSRYNYPGAFVHLTEHTHFIEDISKLRDEFKAGPSSALVIKVQRQVVDWLINHIGGLDKKMADFVSTAERKKQNP